MNIDKRLEEEIVEELDTLKETSVGSDEYKVTVDGVAKLIDRAIEIKKLENEGFERDLKLKQMDEDRKDRLVKNGLAVAGIVIPSALTIWGTLKSFEFEKEGTVTTIMGRGFINKLIPKK